MTKAFIPDRDMPRLTLNQREYTRAMNTLRDRVRLGTFLAEQEKQQLPPTFLLERHEKQHKVTRGWARNTSAPWCGRCVLGNELWERYLAHVVQPIAPVSDDDVAVASIQPYKPPPKATLPYLPVTGFNRKIANDQNR